MWNHVLAVLGLGLLCGGWIALQRWLARSEPGAKGRDGGCSSCSCGKGACANDAKPRSEA